MTVPANVTDTIERSILIAAPVEKVWELVSIPGWWINDGTLDLGGIERPTEDIAVLRDADQGDFFVERFGAEPPRTASFRWLVSGAEGKRADAAEDQLLQTRVTFTLTAEDGGTRLSVTESGFATATMDDQARRRAYRWNSEGWEIELGAARAYVEGS